MERAKALLAKRSESAKVGTGNSKVQVNEICVREKNSVALEKDDRLDVGMEVSGSVDTVNVVSRERKRVRENEGGVVRTVVSKSTVGTGVELPPIIQPAKVLPSVRVEVSPHQRWTYGADVPVQVFQVFDLPQDTTSYVNKTRAEIAERCLTRGGRFFADLTHIVNAYKSGDDVQEMDRLARELAEMKSRKLEVEKRATESEQRAVESEKKATEAAKKNFEAKGKLMEEIKALKDKMVIMGEELKQSRVAAESERKRNAELEEELGRGRAEIVKLKDEVEKSVSEMADAIGVGYGSCYDRVVAAGIDLTGHSFKDYCNDLAKDSTEKADDKATGQP